MTRDRLDGNNGNIVLRKQREGEGIFLYTPEDSIVSNAYADNIRVGGPAGAAGTIDDIIYAWSCNDFDFATFPTVNTQRLRLHKVVAAMQ